MRIIALVVCLASLMLVGCYSGGSAAYVGEWVQRSGERPNSTLTLKEDQTGSLHVRGGIRYTISTWSVPADDVLELTIEGDAILVSVRLNGQNMTLEPTGAFREIRGTYTPAQ